MSAAVTCSRRITWTWWRRGTWGTYRSCSPEDLLLFDGLLSGPSSLYPVQSTGPGMTSSTQTSGRGLRNWARRSRIPQLFFAVYSSREDFKCVKWMKRRSWTWWMRRTIEKTFRPLIYASACRDVEVGITVYCYCDCCASCSCLSPWWITPLICLPFVFARESLSMGCFV
jgi:hypothetical protein